MWTLFVTASVNVLAYLETLLTRTTFHLLYADGRFILTMNYLHQTRLPYFSGDENDSASP